MTIVGKIAHLGLSSLIVLSASAVAGVALANDLSVCLANAQTKYGEFQAFNSAGDHLIRHQDQTIAAAEKACYAMPRAREQSISMNEEHNRQVCLDMANFKFAHQPAQLEAARRACLPGNRPKRRWKREARVNPAPQTSAGVALRPR